MTLGSVQFGINGVNALIGAHFIQLPGVARPSRQQLDQGFVEEHAPLFSVAAYLFRNTGAVNLLSRFGETPEQGLSTLHAQITARQARVSDAVLSQYNHLHLLGGALRFIDCLPYLEGIACALDMLTRSTEVTSEPTELTADTVEQYVRTKEPTELTSDPVEQYVRTHHKLSVYEISPQQLEILYLLERHGELKQIDITRVAGGKVARGSLVVQLEILADKKFILSRKQARPGGGRPNVFINLSTKGRKVLEALRHL